MHRDKESKQKKKKQKKKKKKKKRHGSDSSMSESELRLQPILPVVFPLEREFPELPNRASVRGVKPAEVQLAVYLAQELQSRLPS